MNNQYRIYFLDIDRNPVSIEGSSHFVNAELGNKSRAMLQIYDNTKRVLAEFDYDNYRTGHATITIPKYGILCMTAGDMQ